MKKKFKLIALSALLLNFGLSATSLLESRTLPPFDDIKSENYGAFVQELKTRGINYSTLKRTADDDSFCSATDIKKSKLNCQKIDRYIILTHKQKRLLGEQQKRYLFFFNEKQRLIQSHQYDINTSF